MQVKSIAKFSKGSILQYFRPSLSYHLSFRSLFCLFLSGRFTQVLHVFDWQPFVFFRSEGGQRDVGSKRLQQTQAQVDEVGRRTGQMSRGM